MKIKFTPSNKFVAWLNADVGRAQYFGRVDPLLVPPLISKIKAGAVACRFETALRIERAQKPSDTPLRAEDLLTFEEDLALLRFVRGLEAAPEPLAFAAAPVWAKRNTTV